MGTHEGTQHDFIDRIMDYLNWALCMTGWPNVGPVAGPARSARQEHLAAGSAHGRHYACVVFARLYSPSHPQELQEVGTCPPPASPIPSYLNALHEQEGMLAFYGQPLGAIPVRLEVGDIVLFSDEKEIAKQCIQLATSSRVRLHQRLHGGCGSKPKLKYSTGAVGPHGDGRPHARSQELASS